MAERLGSPESDRTTARHMFRKKSAVIPTSSEVVETLPKQLSERCRAVVRSCREVTPGAEKRPKHRPNNWQFWATSWPSWADVGKHSTKLGRCRRNFGRCWSNVAKPWQFGRSSPTVAKMGPNKAQIEQKLAQLGQFVAQHGQCLSKLGRLSAPDAGV